MNKKLIDSDGKEHKTVGWTVDVMEKPRSWFDPGPDYQEYEPGLMHYFIDDVEVSESEFKRLFPEQS